MKTLINTKSPKLYFYDVGLAASLLGIKESEQIQSHYLKGGLFENLMIAELHKLIYHRGERPRLYFWRDSNGNEVDCLIDKGQQVDILEMKAGKTINRSFFKGLHTFQKFASGSIDRQYIVYGGMEHQRRTNVEVLGWKEIGKVI